MFGDDAHMIIICHTEGVSSPKTAMQLAFLTVFVCSFYRRFSLENREQMAGAMLNGEQWRNAKMLHL